MATVTTNFNFPIPQSTDLVKDGATAIAALGTAIDTDFVDLKGGTTGQVLSKASGTDLDFTWIAQDDSNAIQNAIVDAKGDLIAASAADTPARLAVGNNGETLVADSSTATGLSYQANWAAGKNKIINGDFNVNQRGFTSVTADGSYGFDRWALGTTFGTTYSSQAFTAGTAPVAGYEGTNFARLVTSGQSGTNAISILLQKIEGVRTFAGQTVTVSFWAKAGTGTPKIAVELQQNFGSGGSTTVNTYAGQVTLSTSWARYFVTIANPSISGKTIGTSNFLALQLWTSAGTDFNSRTGSLGIQNATIDIWGVQVEAGSVATAFQTATGTIQGELAACQRYCIGLGEVDLRGMASSSTSLVRLGTILPVRMRVAPSQTFTGTYSWYDGSTVGTITSLTGFNATVDSIAIDATAATGTTAANRPIGIIRQASNGYLILSAEL